MENQKSNSPGSSKDQENVRAQNQKEQGNPKTGGQGGSQGDKSSSGKQGDKSSSGKGGDQSKSGKR